MPRTSRQSALDDYAIDDDEELSGLVLTAFETEDLAAKMRQATKRIKQILEDRHPEAINAHRGGEYSGYVTVNGIRFPAKVTEIDPKSVPAKEEPAKTSWAQMSFRRKSAD